MRLCTLAHAAMLALGIVLLPPAFWALQLIGNGRLDNTRAKFMLAPVAVLLLACAASSLPRIAGWPLPYSFGGALGDVVLRAVTSILAMIRPERASAAAGLFCFAGGLMLLMTSLGLSQRDLKLICQRPRGIGFGLVARAWHRLGEMSEHVSAVRREPTLRMPAQFSRAASVYAAPQPVFVPAPRVSPPVKEYGPEPESEIRTFDNDVDRKSLDRILSICAPKGSAKAPARASKPSGILMEPEALAEPPSYRRAPLDPIEAARGVMAAPGDEFANGSHDPSQGQGAASWPVLEPATPQPAGDSSCHPEPHDDGLQHRGPPDADQRAHRPTPSAAGIATTSS